MKQLNKHEQLVLDELSTTDWKTPYDLFIGMYTEVNNDHEWSMALLESILIKLVAEGLADIDLVCEEYQYKRIETENVNN